MVYRQQYSKVPEHIEAIGKIVVDSALKIHKEVGPGLLERHYQKILIYELKKRGLNVKKEVEVPIYYDNVFFEDYYKIDMMVEDMVIVELKTVEQLLPVHFSQVRTYLKLSNCRLGFLINFDTALAKEGINRVVL